MRLCTNPMKADNQLVAVVLVLVSTCLNWKVRVWLGDSRYKEVDHSPQLFQSVL